MRVEAAASASVAVAAPASDSLGSDDTSARFHAPLASEWRQGPGAPPEGGGEGVAGDEGADRAKKGAGRGGAASLGPGWGWR
jgi:hypothetical protein